MSAGAEVVRRKSISAGTARAGLTILALFIPVSISGMQVGLAIGVVGLTICLFRTRKWPTTPFDLPVALFVILTLLSALFSGDPRSGFQQFLSAWTILPLYLAAGYARRQKDIRKLLWTIIGPAAAIALYGIFQHYTGVDFIRGERVPLESLELGGALVYFPRGTFSHYQTFANVYFLIFCLAFGLWLESRSSFERIVRGLAVLCLGTSLALSFTRGIWISLIISILFILLFTGRKAITSLAALAAVVAILTAFTPAGFTSRVKTIFSLEKNVERLLLWETSWNMVRDHPLLGVGVGNFQRVQEEYVRDEIKMPMSRTHSHNIILQVAAERGVFGLLVFLWIWYRVLKYGLYGLVRQRSRGGLRYFVLLGSMAGMIGFFLDGLFQNNFGDTEVAITFWLVAGIVSICVVGSPPAVTISNTGTYIEKSETQRP